MLPSPPSFVSAPTLLAAVPPGAALVPDGAVPCFAPIDTELPLATALARLVALTQESPPLPPTVLLDGVPPTPMPILIVAPGVRPGIVPEA
jgi:hypothetical protein